MEEPFTLHVEDRKICGVLHLPSRNNPPFVITCHGLFSSKQSDKFVAIAKRFTSEGIAVIRFDFGGCGESSGSISNTTVSGRLRELKKVVLFATNHPKLGKKFGILGSSLGGFISLFYAARNPVSALSVWATPFDLSEVFENAPKSDLSVLKKQFFTDAENYSLSSLLEKTHTVQVIHGKLDETVPWRHAEKIFSIAKDPKKLAIIPGADHSISRSDDRDRAINVSLAWFKGHIF